MNCVSGVSLPCLFEVFFLFRDHVRTMSFFPNNWRSKDEKLQIALFLVECVNAHACLWDVFWCLHAYPRDEALALNWFAVSKMTTENGKATWKTEKVNIWLGLWTEKKNLVYYWMVEGLIFLSLSLTNFFSLMKRAVTFFLRLTDSPVRYILPRSLSS